jgi:hypothetical protein
MGCQYPWWTSLSVLCRVPLRCTAVDSKEIRALRAANSVFLRDYEARHTSIDFFDDLFAIVIAVMLAMIVVSC